MNKFLKRPLSSFESERCKLVLITSALHLSLFANAGAKLAELNFPPPPAGHTDLASYQLQQTQTPCLSLSCLTQLAQSQNALGLYSDFARTMLSEPLQSELRKRNPGIDLQALEVFGQLPPRQLPQSQYNFTVPISNATEINAAAADYLTPGFDARPKLELEFNGKPQVMIFDTGAGLDLPAEFARQFADKFIHSNAGSRTAAALAYASPFVLIDTIKIGPHLLHNSLSSVQVQSGSPGKSAGLFGSSEFLHFKNVFIDIQAGQFEFNSAKKLPDCLPLRLRFNSQNSLDGMVVPLLINGKTISARLDTGANASLLVHNKKLFDPDQIEGDVVMLMKDMAGNRLGLKQQTMELEFAGAKFSQTALIAGFQHPAFDATLGIKFFQRRALLLDFQRSELCTASF